MTRCALIRLSAAAVCVFSATGATAASDEETLRQATQQLLDAVAPGDAAIWDSHLHERFVHIDENGVVRTKAELLKEIAPLPKGLVGSIKIDAFRASIQGDIAVVAHEDQERLDYFGQTLHSRFRSLDTWQRTPNGWRLIGQHVAAVLKDPPTQRLSQEELCSYNGRYDLTKDISTTIRCAANGLMSQRTDRAEVEFLAEVRDVFFIPDQPRSRRIFMRDAKGKPIAFVDRREGEDVRWNRAGSTESFDRAHQNDQADNRASAASDPVQVAEALHAALVAGDSRAMESLLAPNVLILEGGNVERSRQEYAAHHMHADMNFMRQVTYSLEHQTADSGTELAWVASHGTLDGEVDGKRVAIVSSETLVMKRLEGAWRVVHIHWSARNADRAR